MDHSDPKFAKMAGFEKPILHGLCTLGITARTIETLSKGQTIRSIFGRFVSHVFPGDLIKVVARFDGDAFAYQSLVGERIVLDGQGKLVGTPLKTNTGPVQTFKLDESISVLQKKISILPRKAVEELASKV